MIHNIIGSLPPVGKYTCIVIVLTLLILLIRVVFQHERNKGRVCGHCYGRGVKRVHNRWLAQDLGTHYVVGFSTEHICTDDTCLNFDKPKEVKAYFIKIKIGMNWRHVKYGYLLRRERGQV